MRNRTILVIAVSVLAVACGPKKAKEAAQAASGRDFPMVEIPSVYTDPAVRGEYMAAHYWDRFLSGAADWPCDSLTVLGVPRSRLEEQFANYSALLGMLDVRTGSRAVQALFDKAEAAQKEAPSSNVLEAFSNLSEHYLYDPNSPYRNEDLYLPFVQGLAKSSLTDPDKVPAYEFTARNCAKNAAGTPAADFRFTDYAGRTRRLYDIRAGHTLLIFSNPGCEACKTLYSNLVANPFLSESIKSGRIAVVNVYIDEDLEAWRNYRETYPEDWYNGYDPTFTIRRDLLYDVRGIPSVYVLDSEKRVVLKDAPEERVYSF